MSVESFNPADTSLLDVTPTAAEHLKQQLAQDANDAQAVRLSVKESGCTGYMYVLDLVAAPSTDDIVLTLDNSIKLYVDPASVPVVRGTCIDYVTEGLNRQLEFRNPNAQDYCGCGESFNIG
ncbi:iron-sulfur cluster assembly accessory protein [Gilvimarinus agarilyticus]|uniref:HesB/IscA family protein n=1 Tax=unclassified Gilvimarinus TaxID=2642066 RepID=UPI001C08E3BF|nr:MULTISPECIES: iron-sulfur cluster assembly accessory protein [unclassified Gilvimarinus]MBU2887311.1 iron-sulfur cluster assembly accessory protein [Gilvimarinus agarilyticus]MDO6571970.1 iron-sulfur cluster assembly accessory protein [Gilvimarinus sp. 2_MG-2023]MDO6746038.1 iron-sulfur cluster assembly accessory protein [Gilvimarinus sp. 1_MG-2023]